MTRDTQLHFQILAARRSGFVPMPAKQIAEQAAANPEAKARLAEDVFILFHDQMANGFLDHLRIRIPGHIQVFIIVALRSCHRALSIAFISALQATLHRSPGRARDLTSSIHRKRSTRQTR